MLYLSLSSKKEFKEQLRSLIFCYRRSSHVSSSSSVTFCAWRALQSWRTKRVVREHSCVSSRTPPNRGLTRRPHPLASTPCMSPSSCTGEDPQGDCISPFIAKSIKHFSEDLILRTTQDRTSWRRLTVNCSSVG